jgi:hypothetical protein
MTVEEVQLEFKPSTLLILLLPPLMFLLTELLNVVKLPFHLILDLLLLLTLALVQSPLFLILTTLLMEAALDHQPSPELGPLLMLVETPLLVNKPSLLLILLPHQLLLKTCVFSHQMDSTNAMMLPILPLSVLLILAVLSLFPSTMIAPMSILETLLDVLTMEPPNNCVLEPQLTTQAQLLILSLSPPLMPAETAEINPLPSLFPTLLKLDAPLLMFV